MKPGHIAFVTIALMVNINFGCKEKQPQPKNKPQGEVKPTKLTPLERSQVRTKCRQAVTDRESALGRKLNNAERGHFRAQCIAMLHLAGYRKTLLIKAAKLKKSVKRHEKLAKNLGTLHIQNECYRLMRERQRIQGWKFSPRRVKKYIDDCLATRTRPKSASKDAVRAKCLKLMRRSNTESTTPSQNKLFMADCLKYETLYPTPPLKDNSKAFSHGFTGSGK